MAMAVGAIGIAGSGSVWLWQPDWLDPSRRRLI